MKPLKSIWVGLLWVALPLWALSGVAGCSMEKDSETQAESTAEVDEGATEGNSGSETRPKTDETTGDVVKTTQVTGDKVDELIASLANPVGDTDPVCGMKFGFSPVIAAVAGKNYGFCSPACALTFKEDPAKYLHTQTSEEAEDHTGHNHN